MQAGDLALEDEQVVGDEGERVVDLVRDPGGGLAEAGHPCLLEHPALRLPQLDVGLLQRLVRLAELAERMVEDRVGAGQLAGPLLDLDFQLVVRPLQFGLGPLDLPRRLAGRSARR